MRQGQSCSRQSMAVVQLSRSDVCCIAGLQEVFQLFWQLEAADIVAVLPRRETVRAFTFFPRRERCHLAGTPVQVDQWPRVRFCSVNLAVVL